MTTPREEVVLSIHAAQTELERALDMLDELPEPALEAMETTLHALRNYILLARGTTKLLKEELAEYPVRNVHNWLDALLHASELMMNAAEDLRPSAVPVNPRIQWEKVDLGRMAERFCDHYRRKAAPRAIDIECQVDAVSAQAWTDRVMLASILESIFSNAVKFSPNGKGIAVSVQDAPDGVLCLVRDEGSGLSAEERGRLFEPGTRVSPQPPGADLSPGYGLVVAKQLADRLGAKIWCVSEPSQGCCFGISVPRPTGSQDGQAA